jgi:hypothetical protein
MIRHKRPRHFPGPEPRSAMRVRIAVEGGEVDVINTHLSSRTGDRANQPEYPNLSDVVRIDGLEGARIVHLEAHGWDGELDDHPTWFDVQCEEVRPAVLRAELAGGTAEPRCGNRPHERSAPPVMGFFRQLVGDPRRRLPAPTRYPDPRRPREVQ